MGAFSVLTDAGGIAYYNLLCEGKSVKALNAEGRVILLQPTGITLVRVGVHLNLSRMVARVKFKKLPIQKLNAIF